MDIKRLSRQTCRLLQPPGVVSWASVAGRLDFSRGQKNLDNLYVRKDGSRGKRRCRPWPCAAPCKKAA